MKDPNKEVMIKKLHVLVEEINVIVDNYNNKHGQLCAMIDEIGRNGIQTRGYDGQRRINYIKINPLTETVTY